MNGSGSSRRRSWSCRCNRLVIGVIIVVVVALVVVVIPYIVSNCNDVSLQRCAITL